MITLVRQGAAQPDRNGGRSRRVAMGWWCLGMLFAVFAFAPVAQARPFVYVANSGSGDVSQFEDVTGGLSPLSPPTVSASPGASGVAASPDGGSVYVTNYADDTISRYAIASSGGLSFRNSTKETSGSSPGPVVVRADAGGGSAYVVNTGARSVSQYTIAPDGTLSPKSPVSVAAGTGASGAAVTPDLPSVTPSVYVTNFSDSSISQYTIAANGTLSPKSPATVSAGLGNGPGAVAVSPDGHSAYVANGNTDLISQYTVAADGTLSPKTPFTVGAGRGPVGVAVSRDGGSAYVTNRGDPSVSKPASVSQYTIAPNGTLSPKSPPAVPAGNGASAVVLSPDGASAYVTNFSDNTVSRYQINPLNGTLSTPMTRAAGTGPAGIAVTAGPTPGPGPAPVPVPVPGPAPGQKLKPGLAVAHSPANVTGGTAAVPLTCPSHTSGCKGTLTLTMRRRVIVRSHGRRRSVTRTVTVGHAPFSLNAGAHRTIKVSLSASARRSLAAARAHRLKVTATIAHSHRTVTLVQPPARRRR